MSTTKYLALACLVILGNIAMETTAARIQRLGNPIVPSASGVDVSGATFLLNDVLLTEGVVFAYSAFFRTDTPVRFQIWRPQGNESEKTGAGFKLVGETRIVPSVVNSREDVYIVSKLTEKCVRVESGDRLGVFLEESPGAVSYTFDASDPTVFGRTLKNLSAPVTVGEMVRFDPLTFPYEFSVTAHVDTDLSFYNGTSDKPECPKSLLIPNYDAVTLPTTTTLPPTGKPGATGATGPQGAVGATGSRGVDGTRGATGPAGSAGTMGATGHTGPQGAFGATGATGSLGGVGATGPKGERGDTGAPGPIGPAGPPGSFVRPNGTDTYGPTAVEVISGMSMSTLILVLVIWLAVVSLVLFIVVICVAACRRRSDKLPDASPSKFPREKESEYPHPPAEWLDGTMKEDTYKLAYSDSVSVDGVDLKQTPRLEFTYVNEVSLADELSQPGQLNRNDLISY